MFGGKAVSDCTIKGHVILHQYKWANQGLNWKNISLQTDLKTNSLVTADEHSPCTSAKARGEKDACFHLLTQKPLLQITKNIFWHRIKMLFNDNKNDCLDLFMCSLQYSFIHKRRNMLGLLILSKSEQAECKPSSEETKFQF